MEDTGRLSLGVHDPAQAWTFLTRYLPFSLAVRELMRLKALSEYGSLEKPILDVGCGDGLFWECVIRSPDRSGSLSGLLGIDVSADELNLASLRLREHGGTVVNGDICSTRPLGDVNSEKFKSVIANCSLEHVSTIESALRNVHGMMSDGGVFMLFVPVPRWSETMGIKRFATRISRRLGGLVGGALDGFFQHNHLYPAEVWRFLLGGIGFEVSEIRGVGCESANRVFERYLPTAFLSFVLKTILRRYPRLRLSLGKSVAVKRFLNDVGAGRVVQKDLENPNLVEYFIVCRKVRTTS